jgi:Spy/CpxP family protein refolding chaperone
MMSKRILVLALFVLPVLAVGFVTGEERVEKIVTPDGKEMVLMIQTGGEGHEMMMEGMGACCGMMKGMGGPGHMGCGALIGMKDELELTEDQVEKLKTMKMERQKRAINDKAAVEILELELKELLSEETIDIKAVDGKIDRIASLKAKMHKDKIHTMVDSKNVLTAEQKEKLGKHPCQSGGMMKKRIECKKMIKE